MTPSNSAWSRRSIVRNGAACACAGAFVAAGLASGAASAQSAKLAPTMAHYQETPKGKASCDSCTSFVPPSACKVVTGDIRPSGWCMLYALKH